MPDPLPLQWRNNKLIILDQTRLPLEEIYLEVNGYRDVVDAIRRLVVRGAPVIGIAAAYGMALGALEIQSASRTEFLNEFKSVSQALRNSRPTARNLFYAIERMERVAAGIGDPTRIQALLVDEAIKIHREQIASDLALSKLGASLLKTGDTILTHCNAGTLATAGCGTALGVIKQAWAEGKKIQVIASETRPLLQGARLTAYELKKAAIPFTLITDSMSGTMMRQGKIQAVITGADRIAANGDTANKIGTYTHAVLAKEHGIPFYIAAPTSTVDLALNNGDQIKIEERGAGEVTAIQGIRIAPYDVRVYNPAFDVTPHNFITAIITEKDILREPFEAGLRKS